MHTSCSPNIATSVETRTTSTSQRDADAQVSGVVHVERSTQPAPALLLVYCGQPPRLKPTTAGDCTGPAIARSGVSAWPLAGMHHLVQARAANTYAKYVDARRGA